ncbi:MAG: hypothetical protein HZC42_08750 [Candidatus Eisenbacteria bacterium]|nr:hypothetical protein [Candidatus Eisenbacteria bacterium]
MPVRAVVVSLAVASVALGGLSAAVQLARYVYGHDSLLGLYRQFDMDHEANLPTWFSSSLLLVSAALLALIAGERGARRAPGVKTWWALAGLFVFLSMDEAASFHEQMLLPRAWLGGMAGWRGVTWLLPAVLAVVAIVVALGRFVRALPARTRVRLLIATALLLGGEMGLELVGQLVKVELGARTLGYALMYTVEETVGLLGEVAFIYAWLDYLAHGPGPLAIAFGRRAEDPLAAGGRAGP